MMAGETHRALKTKGVLIKQIFHTMGYGDISEGTSLAKSWLETHKKTINAYVDKKQDLPGRKAIEVGDVNGGELLATVYSPKAKDFEKVLSQSTATEQQSVQWHVTGAIERALLLERLAREVERNSTLICQLEIAARGILSTDTKVKALPLLIEYLQYYASWAIKYKKENKSWETEGGFTVSTISDDSFLPVFGFVLGPALAAGYKVILQTEPRISLVATLFIELAINVGMPDDVIRLLPGTVDPSPIFKCMDIGVISHFGNLYAEKYHKVEKPLNKKFLAISSGKAPMIVFNNGDLDSACDTLIDAAWGYQSLLPWSVNTVLVQEDIFQTFLEKIQHCLCKVRMGLASDKMADVSYPVNLSCSEVTLSPKEQLRNVIRDAKLQEIEVFQANPSNDAFQPTLLIGGRLFGNNVIAEDHNLPIITILAFRTSNEAVSLANNTRCGFGASVWTENIGLANEVARKLNVANAWINSHGNFTPTVSMTPRKQSGIGYFGGLEGFLEYINTDMFYPEQLAESHTVSNLPKQSKDNPLQSFYAGSFKKSESGLIDGIYDQPLGKDMQNAIAAAKKGQEGWGKMTTLMRSHILRKVADELSSRKKNFSEKRAKLEIENWISAIYEGVAQTDGLGSVSTQKSYEIRNIKEPVSVVAIEGSFGFVNVIVGALLLGNSVIILNSCSAYSYFVVEICKIFSACSIPAGVFSVILNCNQDILNTFVRHKESNVYFLLYFNHFLHKIKVGDFKRISPKTVEWPEIISTTTKVKNIWANIGDSVL